MTRYYRRRGTLTGPQAASAVVAALVLAALAHSSSHAGTGHTANAAGLSSVTVSAGGMTPASWAHDLLHSAHEPLTSCDLGAIESWESAEGGAWQNDAEGNPLNTTKREPGSHPINGAGVQSYTSWRQGLRATVATLENGDYQAILSALRAGNNAQAVADAVGSSRWGTSWFGASC